MENETVFVFQEKKGDSLFCFKSEIDTHSCLYINSFLLLTFDKTVILEVSRTGTINLAL